MVVLAGSTIRGGVGSKGRVGILGVDRFVNARRNGRRCGGNDSITICTQMGQVEGREERRENAKACVGDGRNDGMFVVVLEASHSPSFIDGLFGIVGHAVKTLCTLCHHRRCPAVFLHRVLVSGCLKTV